MNMITQKILLKRQLTLLPKDVSDANLSVSDIGTIINNFSYLGYMPNVELFNNLLKLDKRSAINWYNDTIICLKEITAEDRDIGSHVVYKNFPAEVLKMSDAEYAIRQLFIYLGVDSDLVSEPVEVRESIEPKESGFKVIHLANENSLNEIKKSLVESKNSWSFDQKEDALNLNLMDSYKFSDFAFKENGIFILSNQFDINSAEQINDATDVLRLALAISQIDQKNEKEFKPFKRSERRYFLNMLEKTKNLEEDMVLNKKQWKKFLHILHPNEYKVPRVQSTFHQLCKNKLQGFNARLENALKDLDEDKVFEIVKQRPGVFANRLHNLYGLFGDKAFEEFDCVINKVDTKKLLKLKAYFRNVNKKNTGLVFSDNGKRIVLQKIKLSARGHYLEKSGKQIVKRNNSTNHKVSQKENGMRVIEVEKSMIKKKDLNCLNSILKDALQERALTLTGNKRMDVDERLKDVKLKNNQNENINFGSGTAIDIPENINVIRTASYWSKDNSNHFWIDNSINFYDEKFNSKGVTCWNEERTKFSVFSGDPIINEEKSAACQLIDVNIEKALESGARYAVLSALSYNDVPLSDFDESKIMVQFCDKAQKGKLFEPSRCCAQFDLSESDQKNNVCVVFDLVMRKMIFINISLPLNISSALENVGKVGNFLEYEYENIKNNPSLFDLLETIHDPAAESKALYSDGGMNLSTVEKHFIFKKENENNQLSLYEMEHFC